MATTAERNARLDELEKAVKQYATAQRRTLTHRVDVNKRILRGRTGSDRLAQASVQQSTGLVVDQIDEFLTG